MDGEKSVFGLSKNTKILKFKSSLLIWNSLDENMSMKQIIGICCLWVHHIGIIVLYFENQQVYF